MRHRQMVASVAALAAAVIGVSGCGQNDGTSVLPSKKVSPSPTQASPPTLQPPTATAAGIVTTTTQTVIPTVRETPRPTSTTATTPTAVVTATSASHPIPAPKLLALSVQPTSAVVGGIFSVSVHTQGVVNRLVFYLSAGPAAFNASYPLTRVSAGVWTTAIHAPPAVGSYHYSVSLYDANNVSHVVDNDNWNIQVGGVPSPTPNANQVPASIPANLPLSPPFSYSNPIAATFSAGGKTYNGAEIVSDSRPDIKPPVVAEWYLTRFPRAGWSIESGGVPAPGITSFTIAASSGAQVCVVSYSNSAIHEFYTTATG